LEECSQSISDPPKNGKSSPTPLDPIDYFPCSVGLYVRVFDEGETAGSGYAHFDSDPKFCSALAAELNRGNRKVKTFTVKGHIESVAYLVAELLAQLLLHTQQTPVVAAVRAAILMQLGKAPNQRITQSKLADALAQDPLLQRIATLPIYGTAPMVGRRFVLSEVKIFVPTESLGGPWVKPEGQR
jgi:hypothetical protein